MKLQLVYFGVQAKAEAARMSLAYGGIAWTDETVTSYFGDGGWPEHKARTPYGQLPLLVVDDKDVIAQTPAIARFVAQLVEAEQPGFCPSSPLAAALCDSVYFAAEELSLVNGLLNVFKDEVRAAKLAHT